EGPGAPYRFSSQESARSNRDSFVVDGGGWLRLSLLLLLNCHGRVQKVRLEVGHVGLEFAYGLLLLRSLRLSGVRFAGGVGCRRLNLLHRLILTLQCISQFLDLLLLLGQGGLLGGDCGL